MISGGNFSLNDVVVEVSNNAPGPIAVPIARVKVTEEQDAGTNLEPEHVEQKARQIKVVNEFERIYVLLINTVAALVDDPISRKLIHHVTAHHLRGKFNYCLEAVDVVVVVVHVFLQISQNCAI